MLKNLREKISANKALCSSIKRVIVLDKIDSTNSYAQSLDNPNDSTVIIANCQTKGRGRNNREWKSFEEKNISISIILGIYLLFDLNRPILFSMPLIVSNNLNGSKLVSTFKT